MSDPSNLVPPDDSGSDAFQRFCYQAHVAFPFCLDCALGGDVLAVVPEHIEDIAVQRASSWQFIQIKTRNPNLGPWQLRHITGCDGALKSALRSHRALQDVPVTIEIHLEGALKKNDAICDLQTPEGRGNPDLQDKVCKSLNIDKDECSALLDRLKLVSDLPNRDAIIATNLRILGTKVGHMRYEAMTEVYERVVSRIHIAMALELLDPSWFDAVFRPDAARVDAQRTFEAKRITRSELQPLVAACQAPARQLLKRVIDPDGKSPTVLEEKLLAGGAPMDIVEDAKFLRAQASIAEFEGSFAGAYSKDEVLEDVRKRLQLRVNGLLAAHENDDRPAIHLWKSLLIQLPGWANTVDGSGLFNRDPDLLLGEICQLADLCRIDWGFSNA